MGSAKKQNDGQPQTSAARKKLVKVKGKKVLFKQGDDPLLFCHQKLIIKKWD